MKKLMTMLSAVALAFGVQAAGTWYSGTSFETMTAGQALDLTSGEGLMWVTNGAPTLTVEALPSNPYSSGIRPTYYQNSALSGAEAGFANALKVQTAFGNPVYRTNETVKTMGEVYVDALVKPTICEDDEITLDSGAKIAIWFKEIRDANDDPVSTNLMITAGYLTSPTVAVSTNYDCGVFNAGADQWQRFTVKSFATIDSRSGYAVPGFVVYRNGNLVTSTAAKGDSGVSTFNNLDIQAGVYYAKNALFPSRVQGGAAAKQQISAIGFDGTGSVDDILFSDDEPSWAAPFKTVTLTWDANVTGFKYTIGMKEVTKSGLAAAGTEVVAVENGDMISISDDTYATDYKQGTFTAGAGITVSGKEFSIDNYSTFTDGTAANIVSMYDAPNVQIGDGTEHYTDLESAFGAINNKSGDVVVKINADGLTFPNGGLSLYGDNLTGVTLDLAGHTITYTGTGYALTASKPLTITNSTVTVGGITASQVVTSSGSLTIYDGVFSGAVTITDGTAAISGGTFNGAIDLVAGSVTGGTFVNNPKTPVNYLATGYDIDTETVPGKYLVVLGTYTITYYDDDGVTELEGLLPSGYTFDQAITLPTPVKEGYNFVRWEDVDRNAFTYEKGVTVDDLELYASWTKQPVTVTVATVENVSITSITTNSVAVAAPAAAAYEVGYGENVEVVYAAAEHYTINGAATYTTNITATAAVTITPPAAVIDSFTVKFISGEGSTTQTVVKAYNATIADSEVNTPAAVSGKNFTGWNPAITFPYTVTADATFTAQYESSGPEPVDPSTTDTVAADTPEAAAEAAAAQVARPSAAVEAVVEASTYDGYFTRSAPVYNEVTGKYEVKISIDETVQTDVETEAVTALTTSESTVKVPAGLYYKISASDSLPIVDANPLTELSDGTPIDVSTKKASGTARFFKIELGASSFK